MTISRCIMSADGQDLMYKYIDVRLGRSHYPFQIQESSRSELDILFQIAEFPAWQWFEISKCRYVFVTYLYAVYNSKFYVFNVILYFQTRDFITLIGNGLFWTFTIYYVVLKILRKKFIFGKWKVNFYDNSVNFESLFVCCCVY